MSDDKFLDTFYEKFIAKSDEIAWKFRKTDFDHQKRMLRESLLMMVMFNRDPEVVKLDMTKLAERHSRSGVDIAPRLYPLWLDALCEAVEVHDFECSPELVAKWRAAMQPGIEFVISKY